MNFADSRFTVSSVMNNADSFFHKATLKSIKEKEEREKEIREKYPCPMCEAGIPVTEVEFRKTQDGRYEMRKVRVEEANSSNTTD